MKHLVLFDVDGTLVQSYAMDGACYVAAVQQVLGVVISDDWAQYPHVTDSGILRFVLENEGLEDKDRQVERAVQQAFLRLLRLHLRQQHLPPIPGAGAFLRQLQAHPRVDVALATGGWLASARLKLAAAGLDTTALTIASADDHYRRTEILRRAKCSFQEPSFDAVTYFGDGIWDQKTAAALGMEFIAVGHRVNHPYRIDDFTNPLPIFEHLGIIL